MTSDERSIFHTIAHCEISTYMTLYADKITVVSTGELAKMCGWSKYRTRKAIKGLVEKGLIKRASCGRPAVESYGEYRELVYDAMPPKNGYTITTKGFRSQDWKDMYNEWCRSMEEWANGTEEDDERKRGGSDSGEGCGAT